MARFTEIALLAGLASLLCGVARAQSGPQKLADLPRAPLLPPFRWFASTDPKHQNQDYFLLKPGETRRVPLAAGRLERLWSTALFPEKLDLRLETDAGRGQLLLSNGKAARGQITDKTYTFFPASTNDSLRNLESGAVLVATNRAAEASKWFFQVAVRPRAVSPAKNETKLTTSGSPIARRVWQLKLAPGEEKTVGSFDKPGQIEEISVAADAAGASTFRNLKLTAIFDGQKAVDAPLLSLAGQIAGDGPLHNAVADFSGKRLVLRWPMPFDRARISLRNNGLAALNLEIGARVRPFDEAPTPFRFCAVQLEKTPQKGRPIEILNLQGAGALVGLAVSLAPDANSRRRAFAYLEGNELIRADGKLFEGTGTEDFFSSAWYFPDKPFSWPFEGMTQKIALPPAVSAYRFLIPDAIPFQKSLRLDFEHGNGNNAEDIGWKITAFWYQKLPIDWPVSDSQKPVASAANLDAPVAPGDRWKIGVAVAAGVLLGVTSRFFKRRRDSE